MLGNKLLGVCETLSSRKWSDPEISEDLEYIKEELSKVVVTLSSFDEYASEVKSGNLEWSPPHLSEQFWKQNASKLSEHDYELVRYCIINTAQFSFNSYCINLGYYLV